MSYSAFYKFFKGKMWPVFAGIGVTAVGLILAMVFMRMRDLRIMSTVGVIIAIVGVALIFIGTGGKANPGDFNNEIQIQLRDYREKALKAFKMEEKHIKAIPLYEPYQIGEFDFRDDENLMAKKCSDGKVRTNFYVNTLIMFTAQKMCIYAVRFSFTEDNESVSANQIPYTEIDSMYVTEDTYTKEENGKKTTAKYALLNIKARNGEVLSYPARNDADVDNFIVSTMKLSDKMKAAAAAPEK